MPVVDRGEHQGINLPGVKLKIPSLTTKDRRDLAFAVGVGVEYIAISFVRTGADVQAAKAAIRRAGKDTPVIAKLEKPEAIDNLEEILKLADGVMVARGDLGVEMRPEQVPVVQKRIILEASNALIPVITATQMLDSMQKNPRPTRAEVSDDYCKCHSGWQRCVDALRGNRRGKLSARVSRNDGSHHLRGRGQRDRAAAPISSS